MKILNTKIGKIFTTDWIEVLIDNMIEKEKQRQTKEKQKQTKKLIKLKKKNGLSEEEKLAPCDSFCNHEYIENVEIVKREPFYNENGESGTIIYQKVTYIDSSVKSFQIYMTLSGLPIPEKYEQNKKKINKI